MLVKTNTYKHYIPTATDTYNMPDFSTTAEEAVTNGVKLMVYAPAGTGKTMLNATLPNPVIVSAESGLLSLAPQNIARVFGADRQDISYNMSVIKVRNIADLRDAYRWFRDSHEATQYQTASVDSITEILEQILSEAKKGAKDPRQAYGELAVQGEQCIREFRDLHGWNVYMSSKMAPYKDELSGITKYGPMAPGSKLGPAIPYFFDMLFALRIGQDEEGNSFRYLQTQPDIQYEAKDRSGALAQSEAPHLGSIIEAIQGSGYVEGDPSTHYADEYIETAPEASAGFEGDNAH